MVYYYPEDKFFLSHPLRVTELTLYLLQYADNNDVLTFLEYSTGTKWKDQYNGAIILLDFLLSVPNQMLQYKYNIIPENFLAPQANQTENIPDEYVCAKQEVDSCSQKILLYRDIYVHLDALIKCLNSYFWIKDKNYFAFKNDKRYKNFLTKAIYATYSKFLQNNVLNMKKDIKLILHELIENYKYNGFYYFYEKDTLTKVEIDKVELNENPHKYTIYSLEEDDTKTYIVDRKTKERYPLHSVLHRFKRFSENDYEKGFLINILHIFRTYTAKEIVKFNKDIVGILKRSAQENCKCCNPDLNNPQKTKLCNNCKQLNEKWENCRSALSKLIEFTKTYNSNKDFGNFVENGEFKRIVFDLKKDEKTSIVKLRNRRKRNLLNRINKLEKALERECFKPHIDNENVEQYVRICKNALIYIKDIKDLIKTTFGNTTK